MSQRKQAAAAGATQSGEPSASGAGRCVLSSTAMSFAMLCLSLVRCWEVLQGCMHTAVFGDPVKPQRMNMNYSPCLHVDLQMI
jgi:hypothetical protein